MYAIKHKEEVEGFYDLTLRVMKITSYSAPGHYPKKLQDRELNPELYVMSIATYRLSILLNNYLSR